MATYLSFSLLILVSQMQQKGSFVCLVAYKDYVCYIIIRNNIIHNYDMHK